MEHTTKAGVELDENGNFVVREFVWLDYAIGVFFVIIFFGILVTRNFERAQSGGSFLFIYVMIALLSIIFFIKGIRNRTIVMVNKTGICYNGNFLTNWNDFLNAQIAEELPTVSNNSDGLSDKFSILVTYNNKEQGGNYMYKMKMSDTQNKSAEQIISAIQYFSGRRLTYDVYDL